MPISGKSPKLNPSDSSSAYDKVKKTTEEILSMEQEGLNVLDALDAFLRQAPHDPTLLAAPKDKDTASQTTEKEKIKQTPSGKPR